MPLLVSIEIQKNRKKDYGTVFDVEAPKMTLLLRNGMKAMAKRDCDYLSSAVKSAPYFVLSQISIYFSSFSFCEGHAE